MKKIIAMFLVTAGIFSAKAGIVAADPLVATISESMVITLPADKPLAENYIIDITALNFASDEVLQQFCLNFSEQFLILHGNFAEKKISVEVKPLKDSTATVWDVTKWNQHLAQRAPKMDAFMKSFNK